VVPGPLVQVRPVLLSADVRSDAGSSERVATAVATEPCWLRGVAESIGEAAGRLSSSDDGRLLHPLIIARRQVTGLRLSAGSAVGWRSRSSGRGPTLTNAAPAAGSTRLAT